MALTEIKYVVHHLTEEGLKPEKTIQTARVSTSNPETLTIPDATTESQVVSRKTTIAWGQGLL